MTIPAEVISAESDCEAIMARNDLTIAQKRTLISQRRAKACEDQFTASFQTSKIVTLVDSKGTSWTISATGLSYDASTSLVELFGLHVLRNGIDVGLDPHQQIVNPPLLFPDPNGSISRDDGHGHVTTYRVDPAACILDHLIGMVK